MLETLIEQFVEQYSIFKQAGSATIYVTFEFVGRDANGQLV